MNRLRRAERWHHSERKKAKARKVIKKWHSYDPNYFPSDNEIGFQATTPKSCSCSMCCNERRRKKWIEIHTAYDDEGVKHELLKVHTVKEKDLLTKQERISKIRFKEQLEDL